MRPYKTKITTIGRVCTICNTFKYWSAFGKNKKSSNGYTCACKECKNFFKNIYRQNILFKQNEYEYKKKYIQSEKGKYLIKTYNDYYRKIGQNNIKIMKGLNEYKKGKGIKDYRKFLDGKILRNE